MPSDPITNVYNIILFESQPRLPERSAPGAPADDPSSRKGVSGESNSSFFDSMECLQYLKTGTVVSAHECAIEDASGLSRTEADVPGRPRALHDSV
jgi:hypothetical protein